MNYFCIGQIIQLDVKNAISSLELFKHGQGEYEEKFVAMISLKGMYGDYIKLFVLQGLLSDQIKKICFYKQ